MEYNKIVAVSGLPGLYEVLGSKTDGAIVRSLEDKSTKFVASRIHNLSHLESIEVYTTRENVNLIEVFNAMKETKESLPDGKDTKALKSYFEKVYPDIDFERVYTSDMKKIIKWFEVLNANGVEIKLSEASENDESESKAEEITEAAPAEEEKPKRGRKKKETE